METDEFDDADQDFYDEDIVTIAGEDGQPIACAILAVLEYGEREFALLAPIEQLTSEEVDEVEMYIFNFVQGEDGEVALTLVEEEEVYEAVRQEFAELMDAE